jgi:glycosyltransferase involved in cell wall biosynthesis
MRIAHVSTFPEARCGIALYASDLIDALPMYEHRKYALHRGKNVTEDAVSHADASDPASVRDLARAISSSSCDVVSLQHEFGIWGGAGSNGEQLVDFLDEIKKPIVATLHTTFQSADRPKIQGEMLCSLVKQSAVTFVLTPKSKETLCTGYGLLQEDIRVIPHGVPMIPYVPPSFTLRQETEGADAWRLCTIGFFRPSKGIETILSALATLKGIGHNVGLVIAGSPQPGRIDQERYLRRVRELVADLGLVSSVEIDARFIARSQQIRLICESHAGIFAYQGFDQASSGTIPLVLAMGRPVICTPFEFAKAKEMEIGEGVTVAGGFDSPAIVEALLRFFRSRPDYVQSTERLYARTRQWAWPTVGCAYASAFKDSRG